MNAQAQTLYLRRAAEQAELGLDGVRKKALGCLVPKTVVKVGPMKRR